MPSKHQPPDDPSSAPESGTNRDETTGNQPSDRSNVGGPGTAGQTQRPTPGNQAAKDDPSTANEEK